MKRLLLTCLLVLSSAAAQPADVYGLFYNAIRTDDLATLKQMLEKGQDPNVTGPQKMTPLLDAALIGSSGAIKLLLDRGAQADAQNSYSVTPLMYARGNFEKVRLLLDHGANPNLPAGGPLFQAAGRKGAMDAVNALLQKGADPRAVNRDGLTALHSAASAGDVETMTLLIEKGSDINAQPENNLEFTPLMTAALNRQTAAVKLLLARGAKVNASTPLDKASSVKNGKLDLGGMSALHLAAPYAPRELIKVLLDAGADPNAKDIQGMTPLMWSVASDHHDPEITRLLLARGADPKIKTRDGETAMDFARRLGSQVAITALGGSVEKPIEPTLKVEAAPDARTALQRSMDLLDRVSSSTFLQTGGCTACHAQPAAQLAASTASKRIPPGEEYAKRIQSLKSSLETGGLQGVSGEAFLLELEALRPLNTLSQRATDYAAASIAAQQNEDGSWLESVPRTPIQDWGFTLTALSARALASYAPPSMQVDAAKRLANARKWLLNAKPITAENYAMLVLGLAATESSSSDVRKAAKALLAEQRPNGGWAQRGELSTDAYATGLALWALADAGQLQPADAPFQRGVKFLLSTQAPDGSWYVKSRAVIRFQPYFNSGFPYETDQWISSMSTGWASRAIATYLTRN